MVRLSFAGHGFAAFAEGALYWPARAALIVADLHFEKASFFARFGQMLPPYDTQATLALIEALVARTNAAEIWCLGDSFHDARGCERLPAAAQQSLRALTGRLAWHWITGNHDSRTVAGTWADHCGGTILDGAVVDGLVLRHEAEAEETRPELSGHFHPKLRLTLKGRRVARRCFVASRTKLILPALGALTGGLDAADPVVLRAAGPGPTRALVPVADRLLSFPLAA